MVDLPAQLQVVPGAVFHISDVLLHNGDRKGKLLVVGCIEPLLLFTINTRPSPWATKRKHVLECHLKIEQSEYDDFLDHDSFLDCYDYYRHELIDADVLHDWIATNKAEYRSRLSDEDIRKMRTATSKSIAIEAGPRSSVLSALEDCI